MGRNVLLIVVAAAGVLLLAMGVTGSYQTVWQQLKGVPKTAGSVQTAANLSSAQQLELAQLLAQLQTNPLPTTATQSATQGGH